MYSVIGHEMKNEGSRLLVPGGYKIFDFVIENNILSFDGKYFIW